MVSTEKRFKAVQALIDAGEYFTINRARQYGKTTMLDMIWRRLKDQYLIIDCPETRDNRRMDLVVTYDRQEFIVELKIWHGDKYEEKGRDQLSSFLATRGMDEGYLVTFDFSKDRQETEPQWIDWNGKRLFEVII